MEIDIARIASRIQMIQEECEDPLVRLVQLEIQQIDIISLASYAHMENKGAFHLRRAYRILQEIKKQGGRNFYLA